MALGPRLRSVMVGHRRFLSVLIVGSLLLFTGIWKLDPHLMLVDEYAAVGRSLQMGVQRDPFPEAAVKGGNFHLYLLAFAFAVGFVYLFLTGKLADVDPGEVGGTDAWNQVLARLNESPAFAEVFYTFVFAGRLVSVLLGIGTIVAVYLAADWAYNRRTALFAAALLATSEGFVMAGHFATEDVLITLLVALYFLTLVAYHRSEDERLLLGQAFVIGLAVSAKAIGGILTLPFAAVLLSRWRRSERSVPGLVRLGMVHGAVAAVGYALTTPTVVVHPRGWWDSMIGSFTSSVSGYTSFDPETGPVLAVGLLMEQLGLATFTLAALGFGYVAYRLRRNRSPPLDYYLVAFVPVYLLFVSSVSGILSWRLIPLIPLLAILGGRVADAVLERAAIGVTARRAVVGALAVVLVFSLANAAGSVALFFDDPRENATEWADDEVPSSATVDVYSPRIHLPEFTPETTVNRHLLTVATETERERAVERVYCAAPEFVVVSSYQYESYLRDPGVQPAVTEMYRRLLDGRTAYEVVARFGRSRGADLPDDPLVRGAVLGTTVVETPGQTILVYRRSNEAAVSC
ncbi:glycosyltransferase family 39 protein [Salinirubellus salinus]|uniref:Glycosyltransferase family 39 protein n=1 Tax=Salinirubellus salinus TaxID=1364945 RepID=A0A9E7R2D9_9EURY|nr:glycosyltransferase family 39 protein [Salinirubellus salinus]UWM54372.1 glycosyltransferase family 39 protein [Salinirubellus salinus]